jgi:hypothetical protein
MRAPRKAAIVEFFESGDFGTASASLPNGSYQRISFKQTLQPEEVAFDPNDFLLKKGTAEKRTAPGQVVTSPREQPAEDYALLLCNEIAVLGRSEDAGFTRAPPA